MSTPMSLGLISGATLSTSSDTMTNTAHGVSLASWVRFGRRSVIWASSLRFSGSALAASRACSMAASCSGFVGTRARTAVSRRCSRLR